MTRWTHRHPNQVADFPDHTGEHWAVWLLDRAPDLPETERLQSAAVALALAERAPASLKLEIVEIGDLPFYNSDLETDAPPAAWRPCRRHWRHGSRRHGVPRRRRRSG